MSCGLAPPPELPIFRLLFVAIPVVLFIDLMLCRSKAEQLLFSSEWFEACFLNESTILLCF